MASTTSRQYLSRSHFFTTVIYPGEFGKKVNLLYNLGSVYFSPIHHGDYGFSREETALTVKKKDHQHIMIRTSRKMTENAFIEQLCELLHNDLSGIALHTGDTLVSDPAFLLRYFYHLDNPLKEHFDLMEAFNDVFPNFTDIVIKAFDKEIRGAVTYNIFEGNIKSFQDICTFGSQTIVFQEWLFRGHNAYVVKNLLDERKKKND